MIICKDCRCFHPVTVSDRYCGDCCIGDTKNPIAINADITECCLFEPKQPKKPKPLTNADRIRQMTDEELAACMIAQAVMGAMNANGITGDKARKAVNDVMKSNIPNDEISKAVKWLKQEVSEDA